MGCVEEGHWARSPGQDVVDHDRRLFGDRDQVVVVTGQQTSAYGTVAERDPPTRATQVEPLTRDDDPGKRTPVRIHDLGPEDLDSTGAGNEVPPTQGARELAPPMPRHPCAAEQVLVHVAHGEGITCRVSSVRPAVMRQTAA